MTHTPGPWSINRENLQYTHEGMYQSGLIIEGDGGEAAIASLIEWQSPLEAEANACLLVSAPDLLSGLKWAIKELCEAWDEPAEKAIPADILAAIAKAEGKEVTR